MLSPRDRAFTLPISPRSTIAFKPLRQRAFILPKRHTKELYSARAVKRSSSYILDKALTPQSKDDHRWYVVCKSIQNDTQKSYITTGKRRLSQESSKDDHPCVSQASRLQNDTQKSYIAKDNQGGNLLSGWSVMCKPISLA